MLPIKAANNSQETQKISDYIFVNVDERLAT
mgnify:CR=1 FL=1